MARLLRRYWKAAAGAAAGGSVGAAYALFIGCHGT
jgi:hypothetical protein